MRYASISDLRFAIEILKLSSSKLPEDSYAKLRVSTATNRVIFELEDIIKQLQIEQVLENQKDKLLRSEIED